MSVVIVIIPNCIWLPSACRNENKTRKQKEKYFTKTYSFIRIEIKKKKKLLAGMVNVRVSY